MKTSELDKLIEALKEDQISAEDLALFDAEVTNNPESMSYYLSVMDIENFLEHQYEQNDHELKTVVPIDSILNYKKRKTWALVALSAAALFIFGFFVLPLFNTDQLTITLGPDTDTHYSLRHEGSDEIATDLVMNKGSRLEVYYGTVELNFESGVRAVVQDPADIELLKNDQLQMHSGVAWYYVPSGAEGFTVRTNDLNVVDLGTEFGVKASFDDLDEVHVITGKVEASSLGAKKESSELSANKALKISSSGELKEIPIQSGLFIKQLPTKSTPNIVFEDQFNRGLHHWRSLEGSSIHVEGNYTDSAINTLGTSDHSLVHFDKDGKEVKASEASYIALGSIRGNFSLLTTEINIRKGLKYTIFFRYTNSRKGDQNIAAAVRLDSTPLVRKSFRCLNEQWASASVSFTANDDGLATVSFSNIGSNNFEESDTLIDSVLITSTLDK